jgi:hypothetical protein
MCSDQLKYRARKKARELASIDLIINSGLPFKPVVQNHSNIIFDFGNGVRYYPSKNVCLIGTRRKDFLIAGTQAFIDWYKEEFKIYLSGV